MKLILDGWMDKIDILKYIKLKFFFIKIKDVKIKWILKFLNLKIFEIYLVIMSLNLENMNM